MSIRFRVSSFLLVDDFSEIAGIAVVDSAFDKKQEKQNNNKYNTNNNYNYKRSTKKNSTNMEDYCDDYNG